MGKQHKLKMEPLTCDICGKGVNLRRGYVIDDGILCHRKHGKKKNA